jgi:hypothetical protein
MGWVLMRIEVSVKYYEIVMVPGWHFRFAACVTSIGKWCNKAICMFVLLLFHDDAKTTRADISQISYFMFVLSKIGCVSWQIIVLA